MSEGELRRRPVMLELWDGLEAAVKAADPEVEQLKAAAGHGEHVGWAMGGEPYMLRCSCGLPLRAVAWVL